MLYHIETGIPFKTALPESIDLHYSNHAIQAAKSDRYGDMELVPRLKTQGAKVIELETDETGRPIKIVVRAPYDETKDAIFVISLTSQVRGANVVKTVWFNLKTDTHKSLNKSNYKVGA